MNAYNKIYEVNTVMLRSYTVLSVAI